MEIIITQKDIIEVYRSFKICLEFLSKVFLETPRVEFIEQLVKKDLFSEWPLPGREAMSEGLRLMQAFCADWQPSQHKEVKLDFTQLFTGCEKLLLLSNLCEEAAAAADVDKPQEEERLKAAIKQFLQENMLKWIDPFMQHIAENAATDYYRGAAYLTKGTVEMLAEFTGLPSN